MSLADLTRHCFQNGISASKWVALCRLHISKGHATVEALGNVEEAISNSVLVLYRSYPADSHLQDYLKCAIQNGLITVPHYVATLLQAARSPELHTPLTLDTLCRVALDAHASSLLPIHSMFPNSQSPHMMLGTIQDALALLRTAHSLQLPHHPLMTAASQLVILLLSCVTDVSQVSSAQAMVHFTDANDILQTLNLSDDLKQALQTFVVSLSLQIGDNAKMAREGHTMHAVQIPFRKADVVGASSNTDIVTCGLILHYLVAQRAKAFGSGSGTEAVVTFVGAWRSSSWTPTVFYTQLLLSALTCLSQCGSAQSGSGSALLWYSFVIGRLPRLLAMFDKIVTSEQVPQADWREALQAALTSVLRRSDLVLRCDHALSQASVLRGSPEDLHHPGHLSRDVLQQFLAAGLIDQTFAVTMDPTIQNDTRVRFLSEAHDAGVDLESYLDFKITPETTADDFRALMDRVWSDPSSHADFSEVVRKRFASFTDTLDVEAFHHICKALYLDESALDFISLHVRISDLIFYALSFLEGYECETVGDPQTAISHLGHVVLFLQSTLSRYHLTQDIFTLGDRSLSSAFLRSTAIVQSVESLSGESATAFSAWFKALFDSSSDGIEDTTFRSTSPKVLLRISATLLSHAISAYSENKISVEVLTNGVAYFTASPLNWTLVGVIKVLLSEIEQAGFGTPHLDILQTLLLSSECPRPVLSLCGPLIMRLLRLGEQQHLGDAEKFYALIRQMVAQLPGIDEGSLSAVSQINWEDQPRLAVRQVLTRAGAGAAPSLDIDLCLLAHSPARFLKILWSELSVAAGRGEMETCRRIFTFVLTAPRASNSPPLFPVFIHTILPLLITTVDLQHPQEQMVNIEFLVTILSSALAAALHLEWALHLVTGQTHVRGQGSAVMLSTLARQLRDKKHSLTSKALAQRLCTSTSFMVNFPSFRSDLERS